MMIVPAFSNGAQKPGYIDRQFQLRSRAKPRKPLVPNFTVNAPVPTKLKIMILLLKLLPSSIEYIYAYNQK